MDAEEWGKPMYTCETEKLFDFVNIACRLQIYTKQVSDNFLNLN